MERQGRSYIGFQIFPGSIFLGVVLAILLLSVSGWGRCQSTWATVVSGGACACDGPNYTPRPSTYPGYESSVSNLPSNCVAGPYICGSAMQCVVTGYNKTCCSNQCEADSLRCVQGGGTWRDDPSASCGKSCGAPCPESVCDAYRQRCEQVYKGIFTGNCVNSGEGGAACCHGYCDICGGPAVVANYNEMKDICCNKRLMAPPKIADFCLDTPPLQGGCGVYQSTYWTNGENWACHDPNQSKKMMDRYEEECLGTSSSSGAGEGSSSSGGGSSGGDGSSSGPSPYPEGCDECSWLDSILDTLTAQKKVIEDIKACVYYPALCNDDGEQIQIDTSLLPYIRPFMDSSIALSKEHLRMLVDLDTNILKILAEIKDLPESDTAVKLAIDAMSSNIEGKLTTVNTSVVNMNDSTKKWLRRLADSLHVLNDSNGAYIGRVADKIGISTDSLVKHLDSIKERIPSAVLDSILKYQKLAAESSDSIVLGDLPSIDSLIDSTVRYWKELREYDSVHHAKISDSLGSLHDAIDDISWRMGVIMGYGDTASSNLRGDINAVEGAVNVFRDSSLYYWRQFLSSDSAYRVQFGDGVTTISGAVSGVQGAVEGLGSTLGSIDGKLDGVAVDTNVDYGILREGNALRDTILDETGLGRISFGDDTTAYLQAESAQFDCVGDSCCVGSDCVYVGNDQQVRDSFMQVMSAYADTIRMKNEAVKQDSFTSYVSQLMDSVTSWNPLGAFDSTILSTLGSRMPNSNTCPEDCFVNDVTIPFAFGPIPLTINYGLCTPRAPLANGNVLSFLRFLIRLFVAIACVYTIMWNAAGRKGG